MKKIITSNPTLLDILSENGIILICNTNMDIVISDEDAKKLDSIVKECASSLTFDYNVEEAELPTF